MVIRAKHIHTGPFCQHVLFKTDRFVFSAVMTDIMKKKKEKGDKVRNLYSVFVSLSVWGIIPICAITFYQKLMLTSVTRYLWACWHTNTVLYNFVLTYLIFLILNTCLIFTYAVNSEEISVPVHTINILNLPLVSELFIFLRACFICPSFCERACARACDAITQKLPSHLHKWATISMSEQAGKILSMWRSVIVECWFALLTLTCLLSALDVDNRPSVAVCRTSVKN